MREATLITDRADPSSYRVEHITEDGGCEVAVFSGPDALFRAAAFAGDYYDCYDDPENLTEALDEEVDQFAPLPEPSGPSALDVFQNLRDQLKSVTDTLVFLKGDGWETVLSAREAIAAYDKMMGKSRTTNG